MHVSGGPESPRFQAEDKAGTAYKNAEFYSNGVVVASYLNTIASRLVEGKFSNRNEAIELLLDYKTLNSLPFSIEGMNGTQFKNIVKMNFLVAHVNQQFSDKIGKVIVMPYAHKDAVLSNIDPIYASPEIAVLIKGPDAFKNNERDKMHRLTSSDKKVAYKIKCSSLDLI